MKVIQSIEKFLRSREFLLCAAIFSVLFLTPATYFVYWSMLPEFAPIWREIASAGVALLVASGLMIYTVRGNKPVAGYYMWFEISISSFYYITTIGLGWALIPAFSFVFMLPLSLKHYTDELNKDKALNANTSDTELKRAYDQLIYEGKKSEAYYQAEIKRLTESSNIHNVPIDVLKKEIDRRNIEGLFKS